uniref:Selenoprotein H n=1 Tax=Erpetoichthys calabaricus TaxID=27687 RepID=A0A8C4SD22_ERPCA
MCKGDVTAVIYQRNAVALQKAIEEAHPSIPVELNPLKPRRNSFEVTFVNAAGTEVNLWSGLKKGPPRKLKFPDTAVVLDALKGAL